MTELGVGYLSIVADTSKIPGQVNSALGSAQASATNTGRSMGSKIASGIGSTLKGGAVAAGAVAATALTLGMQRVVAIDDAKGKLAGLGHTAEGVTTIMDSALASVKGTAFGMGDAATIAASAVAAGIKPGQELTKYLSLTGDAATIAGSSLEEMGSIFNKVQTSGKAYTDNLNQLSDRGIPIFQWLADEYGVTQDALSDMVKEGKVDAETFNKVIQDNIGGAALESGKTLRGSFANMKAALGRAGAEVITPFLPMMKAGLAKVTEYTDKVAPILKAGATKVASGLTDMGRAFQSSGASIDGPANKMEKFGVKARQVADGLKGVWSILSDGKFTGSATTFGLSEDSKAVDTLFKIRETAIGVKDILFKGDYTNPIWGQLEDSKAVDVLFRIREGAQALWDVIRSPSGEKFTAFLDTVKGTGGDAAGAMGKVESGASTLTGALKSVGAAAAGGATALVGLGGDTATVAVAGIKALGGVMGFFADHTGLATVALGGLAAAFAISQTAQTAFHMARVAQVIMTPAEIASRMAMTAAIVAQTAVMRAHIVALGGEAPVQQLSMRQRILATAARQRETAATIAATSSLAAYATAQRAAATQSGLMVGTLRQTAAGVATLGSKVQGVGGAALSSMRSGLQRVGSMLGPGGLFTIGLMAAGAAVTAFVSTNNGIVRSLEESRGAAGRSAQTFREYRTSLDEAFSSSGGNIDTGVKSVVKEQISSIEKDLSDAAGRIPSKWEKVVGFGSDVFQTTGITAGLADIASFAGFKFSSSKDVSELEKMGEAAKATGAAFKDFGITSSDIAKGISGSDGDWQQLQFRMNAAGGAGSELTQKYGQMRAEFVSSRTSASAVSDAFTAMQVGAVGAAAGVDGLTSSMATWRGDLMTAEEAQAKVTLALSGFNTAAANAGASARTASGELDMTNAAGAGLHREMQAVATAFDAAGSAAAQSAVDQKLSAADTAAAVQAAGQKVRDEFIRQRMDAGDTLEKATALANQYKLWPEVLPTHIQLTGADEAQAAIDNFIKNNTGKSVDIMQNIYSQPAGPAMPTSLEGMYPGIGGGYTGMRVPGYEGGGKLPTTGPGTHRVDGILGVDSRGIPTARVNRGEWVINDHSSEKYDRELAAINAGVFPKLPGYEAGGVVGSRDLTNFVTGRVAGVKPLTGDPYVFGGINWGDCSAAMSAIARFAVGLAPFAARFATASMGAALAGMGFQSGRGGAGDLRFGWYNGGPGGGHTAGTLPDGTNVEMGGSYGGGMVGGAVGSNHSSFTDHAFKRVAASGSQRERVREEWTEKQQIELQAAEIALRKAEEKRTEVEEQVAEGKKTQTDLADANNKVDKAQSKLTELQRKKDGVLSGESNAPAPQAPELSRMFTDAEVDRIDAQLAVQSANQRRNEVYDNPESSDYDIDKADAELYQAEKALRELGTPKAGDGPTTWSGIAGDFAKNAVSGFVSDALGVFGIPDEMPPALQALQMFEKAQQTQAPYLIEPSADQRAMGAQVTTSPSMIAEDSPAIYNPAEGVARWGDSVAKGQDGIAALLAEIERMRSGNRFANGGPVSGPGGTDNVPAWLTPREFVVNALDANAGQNPAILQAMNSGARLSLGQGGQSGSTYIFNGVANVEEGLRQLRVKELQEAATHGWGIR
ncbi:tape measure protein [Rhodococcus sp. IEGM 1409]|uniref:tape measure protein n=1 Tax=Rhodococcus sp. IEGM 1409 TaxID=3047082 RepID=UPI0024B6B58B|nr:tape measure protein [Rhodococcus sp. IEGM 1409]MDI9903807.1 tape measure protein [Rhodococcus sp. IEGM 1409]